MLKVIPLIIPTLFGFSIEVYFIIIVLGFPTYFFLRWLLKKFIQTGKTRKFVTWIMTIVLTPFIYMGLITIMICVMMYYPTHHFDQTKWFVYPDKRYELSGDLIKSKILIAKTKLQVGHLIGYEGNKFGDNVWYYDLGTRPELFNIDPDCLEIDFNGNIVSDVIQHRH